MTLCETLYDLRLALYTLQLNNNAMRFALCPLRSFVCRANFFMDDTIFLECQKSSLTPCPFTLLT